MVNRAKEYEEELNEIDSAEKMSDNEVREKFLKAKEWGKMANDLKQSKEKILTY